MISAGQLEEVAIQGAPDLRELKGHDPRHPLCFSELILLIDELAEMSHPPEVVRFEGFDPSSDTIRLLEYARARRLSPRVRLAPALSVDLIEELAGETGAIIVIPVEGSVRPDRGDTSIRVAEHAASIGLDVEIETLLRPSDLGRLESLARFVKASGFRRWQIDFLGKQIQDGGLLRGRDIGRAFSFLNGFQRGLNTVMEIREAPSFIRFMKEATRRKGHERPGSIRVITSRDTLFISAAGEVMPGRALRIPVGDVRSTEIERINVLSPILASLRDPAQLRGRCGTCELNSVCGGSRARAWRVSRNLLAEDPGCYRAPVGKTTGSITELRADHY